MMIKTLVVAISAVSGSIYGIRVIKAFFHLENMLRVNKTGAVFVPPNPSLYNQLKKIHDSVDTLITRILDHLVIENTLLFRRGS